MIPAEQSVEFPSFRLTRRRVLTRRGVLWLGQTCNLRCEFCYFYTRISSRAHPEHAFMDLEKAKKICSSLVEVYDNNAIDIQGGEPTIYPHIHELVYHCREIGLLPSLITNGLVLANREKCRRLKEAGLRDFLFSVHALGETYDRLVGGISGASRKQNQALDNCLALGIPVRFNCVLSRVVIPQLEEIAALAVATKVRVVNFIAFNPFEDQQIQGRRSAHNVPRYSDLIPYLTTVMDRLEAAGIECNVRYYPVCLFPERHRKSVYGFQQLSYDLHEWDYASWSWTGQQAQKMKWGGTTPPFSLVYATYDRYRLDDRLKKIKLPVEKYLLRYPRMVPRLAGLYHRIAPRLLTAFSRSEAEVEDRDALYRENGRIRARKQCYFAYGDACSICAIREICDGFHGDYAGIHGTGEARPITGLPLLRDPRHYIAEQEKVVEVEDFPWAL